VTASRISARTVVAIVGLALFAVLFAILGRWQLHRADENRALAEQFAAGSAERALKDLPPELTESNRFHRVEVEGTFAAAPQFLLDNMLHDGVAGYHVLTVLRLEGTRRRLIVNRGWVGAGADRRVLPDVSAGAQARRLTGRIERLPRPGLRLGPQRAVPVSNEPVTVVQYPTAVDLEVRLGVPVYDYQVLLDPGEPGGYARDWTAPGVGPERNLIYAGQWLLLAAGAFGAAVTIAFKSTRRP
jgi:surfeit locus 1 family protein